MGKVAFVFSGQGAQKSGMGKELKEASASAAAVFAMADGIRPGTSEQCFLGTNEELSMTRNTQPCLFCVDLAAARALAEKGFCPDYLAGFSLGEIPALAFGGYLSDEEAFRFVVKRSQYMDECGKKNPGVMYAVLGLTAGEVQEICSNMDGCYPVNYNGETQTVVSCQADHAKEFAEATALKGGKPMKLPVSGGFHSPMMDEAKAFLEKDFADLKFTEHKIPVFANATGLQYESEKQLFEQVNSPVLWHQLIRNLSEKGVDTFIEVGVGKTLTNLIRKALPTANALNVEDPEGLLQAEEVLKHAAR